LLYALGRLQSVGSSTISYEEAEPRLAELLRDFGPARSTTPAYPFHHLQSDHLWVVTAYGPDPGASPARLRASGATGSLDAKFEAALLADPPLIALVARELLDENFPVSLHADICTSVNLDLESLEIEAARAHARELRRRRDPAFRERILVAYEYRCSMCGYDGRLGATAVALDAAHIRWWAFDGPDTVDNALCLCSFHHKLLDRGVLGVDTDHRVTVSAHFVGRGRAAEELVLRLVDEPLLSPQPGNRLPDPSHVEWHTREVFRSPARQSG
jgi:putative restriction endonuclease